MTSNSVSRAVGAAARRAASGWRALALATVVAGVTASMSLGAADLRPFVRGSWKQIRQAHDGRPVVVHFWGVTCAPCMSELPKWADIAKAKPGVDIVFVAADPVPIEPPNIEAAAARTGIAPAENWMFSDSFLERLRFEVSPQWGGELPYTVMVDASGRVESTAGVMDIQRLRTWIARQTSRTPSPK